LLASQLLSALLLPEYLVLLLVCDVPGMSGTVPMSAVTGGRDVALKSRLFRPLIASLLLAYRTFCCLCPCCFYIIHAVDAVTAIAGALPFLASLFFSRQNKTETRINFAFLSLFLIDVTISIITIDFCLKNGRGSG
jgi:hypothetical protein